MGHADGEVNKHIADRETILAGSLGNFTVPSSYIANVVANSLEHGVSEEMLLNEIEELQGDDNAVG